MYLSVCVYTNKGKKLFYWIIYLQQIIPLILWKVIKAILNYVLIKYAKSTYALSVFTQYAVHRNSDAEITAFTFLTFFSFALFIRINLLWEIIMQIP